MPRPTKNQAQPVFTSRFGLSEDERKAIAKLLENQDPPLFREVDRILGFYVDGREHVDNQPRPAHYVAEFTGARQEARKLFDRISEWTGYYRDQFSMREKDLAAVEIALVSFISTATDVIDIFKKQPSKGAPKKIALEHTISALHKVFTHFYRGPTSERSRRGATQTKSVQEQRELDFITLSLSATGINTSLTDSSLPRLLRKVARPLDDEKI